MFALPARPDDTGARTVRLVADCHGRRWAVDPDTRTVYVDRDGDPDEIGRRVAEALTALAEHDRPQLRLIQGGAE